MSVTLTLSAATSADTGWLDVSKVTDDWSFDIKGSWAGGDKAIVFDVSLDPTQTTKDYDAKFTYTANSPAVGVPRLAAAFCRWRRTGTWGASDIADINLHGAKNSIGEATDFQIESLLLGGATT